MNAENPQGNSQAVKPKDPRTVVTPKCRLNYAHVFTPRPGPSGGEPAYSATLVFDPGTDLTMLKNAAYAAAQQKWGDKKPKTLRSPFRSNSDREGQDGFAPGGIFITARTKTQPGLIDQAKRPVLSSDALYSGCYVRAHLQAFAYTFSGNSGVSFALMNIQKWADGDRLDNRHSADQVFDPLPLGDDSMFDGSGSNPLNDDVPF